MRQNLVAQFIQVLKHWLWDMQSGLVVEKNLALSVDHCQLQALQFLVRVINLLSIPLRCNGFAGIQKAVMKHPLTELFHLSNLLQILNYYRRINVEFVGNLLCSCKKTSFNDSLSWSLSTSDGQPL